MNHPGKPHVLVLGGNFAGLTTARFIREQCGEDINITVIDRKPYLLLFLKSPLRCLPTAIRKTPCICPLNIFYTMTG